MFKNQSIITKLIRSYYGKLSAAPTSVPFDPCLALVYFIKICLYPTERSSGKFKHSIFNFFLAEKFYADMMGRRYLCVLLPLFTFYIFQ